MSNPRHPPRAAVALLQRLGPLHDDIAGDLIEDYHAGRSTGWFWTQTIYAVFAASFRQLRGHPILVLRSIVIAAGMLDLLLMAAGPVTNVIVRPLLTEFHIPFWRAMHTQIPQILGTLTATGASMAVAWAVGGFHRDQRIAMTLVIVALWLISFAASPDLHRLVANAMTHRRFVPYLIFQVAHALGLVAGFIIGAIVLNPPALRFDRPRRLAR
jgi:hypothetical protein